MVQMTDLRNGEKAVITQITGGRGLRKKMTQRGIKEGNQVQMVSSSKGPVVIECGGNQIALGRGMAKRVIVRRR